MPKEEKLSGKKKAAILLLSMGPEISSRLLKQFTEQEIETITMEIANLSRVEKELRDEVLEEFMLIGQAQQYMLEGGIDYARELLEKTLGHHKAVELIKRLKEQVKVKPFTFVRHTDPKQLVNMISREHPQTIAMILSYLDSQQAAMVLSDLPGEMRADIARRVALMERTSPEILKEVESVLRDKLSTVFQQDFTQAGGLETVVDILNRVDRGTEKLILEELEKDDAELADEIRQRMFIFEDIITLDDASIQRVVREVDSKDLARALKGASEEVKDRIFRNISKRAAEMLREDLEFMGPVRLREVEESQQRIVAIIRRLDESGEIIISRGGEDAVVI
ncbi:MAG TPA: flagellar motor switch protein FliG [Firmicutes bacterium]|nr:flagellar motor switch protein FliG [Bacillota bacterium]